MLTLTLIQKIVVWIIPVLFAITFHEAAHAWMANRCGDTTAKMLGRLSINPLRHVDLIGTIVVPLLVAILSQFQFIFGWAKPVPINWSHLKKPRRDMLLVAAAGPVSIFIMAILWAGLYKIASLSNPQLSKTILFLLLSSQAGILINFVFAILNLIPIPPLDGSRIIASLLPPRLATYYQRLEPFGFFILLALLFTGILTWLISPLLSWAIYLITLLFHL